MYDMEDYSIKNKDRLKTYTDKVIARLTNYPVADDSMTLIEEMYAVLMGNKEFNISLITSPMISNNSEYCAYFSYLLNGVLSEEDINHPIITSYFKHFDKSETNYRGWNFILSQINKRSGFIEYLIKEGFTEQHILERSIQSLSNAFITFNNNSFLFTNLGEYFKEKLESKRTGIFSKSKGFADFLIESIKSEKTRDSNKNNLLIYLHKINPEWVEEILINNISLHNGQNVNQLLIQYLTETDFDKYHKDIYNVVSKMNITPASHYIVNRILYEKNNNLYLDKLIEIGNEYVSQFFNEKSRYFWDHIMPDNKTVTTHYFELLKKKNNDLCKDTVIKFVDQSWFFKVEYLEWIAENLKEESLNIILKIFNGTRKYLEKPMVQKLFEFLYEKEFYQNNLDTVIQYCLKHAGKNDRMFICKELSKVPAIENLATEMLNQKKTAERLTGALILAELIETNNSSSARNALLNVIDDESNDETRNIILDATKTIILENIRTQEQCKDLIHNAEKRKKLNTWTEKYMQEDDIPALYWNDGVPFTQIEKRFLLYRMKQVTGLQSDIEAKLVINHIDRQKSEKFASHLIERFLESNSDTKIKHYLVLCGLMGNDNILNKLHALFKKCLVDKRVKLAEHVLGAIAMIGSNKALRILEVISRKIANKKPKVAEYAQECLQAAADELNITKDELADRIIPNFDFDGLYRSININGEEYRAFINDDFEVVFFDENNKSRKSMPKEADKELIKDFKEIAKEVKEISKTQTERLEQLMAEERCWPGNAWKSCFLTHPIMNVFATKLIWALKSSDWKSPLAFYCDEDGTTYTIDGDEIEIEDHHTVSILHPIMLDEPTLNAWKDKYYEESKKTIFPVLERKVYEKLPEELDRNTSYRFANSIIPKGADWVAPQLLKKGWTKNAADGGYLEFNKKHNANEVIANPYIEGPAAFYQGGNTPAKVNEIYFKKAGASKDFTIKDVPDIFYSEVMSDIDYLISSE